MRRRLVSFHSMIAGTPPEIGTNEARLANPGPEFHWYNLLLLTTRRAAAPSCNDRISFSVSDPMLESAPISPCRETPCFDYGSPPSTSRPTRPAIWGLTASNSTSRALWPFSAVQAPRFIIKPPLALLTKYCKDLHRYCTK